MAAGPAGRRCARSLGLSSAQVMVQLVSAAMVTLVVEKKASRQSAARRAAVSRRSRAVGVLAVGVRGAAAGVARCCQRLAERGNGKRGGGGEALPARARRQRAGAAAGRLDRNDVDVTIMLPLASSIRNATEARAKTLCQRSGLTRTPHNGGEVARQTQREAQERRRTKLQSRSAWCGRRAWPHARRSVGCDDIPCRGNYRRGADRRARSRWWTLLGGRRTQAAENGDAGSRTRPAADRTRESVCGEPTRLHRGGRGVGAPMQPDAPRLRLLAQSRLALAIEHGADAEVAHLHRPARGDEGEKRRGHRRLAGGRADQAQHPVAPHASGAQRLVWLTRSPGGRRVCPKRPPRARERAEGLARSPSRGRCLPSPDGLWRPRSI
eukprot:COSAG06_NODE_344_length_17074_cov_116.626510_12_plen_381_part_00